MLYSFHKYGDKVKSWSIPNKKLKYEIEHESLIDIVIGREGTPLVNKILSINPRECRISKLKTGAKVKTIKLDEFCCQGCWSVAVNETQTLIAVGSKKHVTFIKTTNFTEIKKVSMSDVNTEDTLTDIKSLAFNRRNDCMLAVLENGEVHSFSPN